MNAFGRAPEEQAIEVIVRRWLDAVTRGPVEMLRDLYLGDATEIIARAEMVRGALEELDGEIDDLVIEVPRAAWRWTVSGRLVGALPGIEPTGQRVGLSGVNFQRFQDGRVVEHWTTVDLSSLAART